MTTGKKKQKLKKQKKKTYISMWLKKVF